jgi:cation-transporting ATPase 13A1
MRKILFSNERITVNSKETFAFIGVLVIFALISSGVVLYGGLNDPYRNRFKLILHCIMIVTSVVPPELPMELSLAVTNSLATLAKNFVYCTEPYRIPLAGRIDVLCFDKTGFLLASSCLSIRRNSHPRSNDIERSCQTTNCPFFGYLGRLFMSQRN